MPEEVEEKYLHEAYETFYLRDEFTHVNLILSDVKNRLLFLCNQCCNLLVPQDYAVRPNTLGSTR
jgi:hypothetical protein